MKTADRSARGRACFGATLFTLSFIFVPLRGNAAAADPAAAGGELRLAVKTGEAAKWRAVLAANADVNARDADGNTALHFAALNHDAEAVRALLAAGAEADVKNAAAVTPLIYGAGDVAIVRALLDRGANPNAASASRNTPLIVAATQPNSSEAVRLLIEAGADIAVGNAALARATAAQDRRTVDLLLAKGVAKNATAAATALAAAAMNGDTALVELLLSHGADPNFDPNAALGAGHTLNRALQWGQLATAKILIEHGANLNARASVSAGTPTMVFAAYNQAGDDSIVRALVARGVDVGAADRYGMTAYGYALRHGAHTPLAKYLQSLGAKSTEPVRSKQVPDRSVPPTAAERAALVKARLQRSLDVLQSSSNAFLGVQRVNCTSCHGQDLPAETYRLARARGFRVDEEAVGRQFAEQLSIWSRRAEPARQLANPIGGGRVAMAYGFYGLRAGAYVRDDITDAMARYFLRTQRPDGSWGDFSGRPPMQDGQLVATAWIALALRDYPPTGLELAAADSQARSARWLAAQRPATHNESVFQLLGLHWSGVPASNVGELVARVAGTQRTDGGWAQLPGLESDAWATGTALYALHVAGDMKPADPVYQRGVAFLLRTQFDDGSWWVRTRSWPLQPHFDGQFPHGKDQWISQAATAWSATALLFTLDPLPSPPIQPTVPQLVAKHEASVAAQRKAAARPGGAVKEEAPSVSFARDIKPILERSCAGCHGGEKPRGGYAVASRELLLKGGASGEPAILPGSGDDSPLVHYVAGKVEDLEMPPLDRRDKYPGLTVAEIALLRAWIDAGAPDEPAKTAALP